MEGSGTFKKVMFQELEAHVAAAKEDPDEGIYMMALVFLTLVGSLLLIVLLRLQSMLSLLIILFISIFS